jgi:predicted transcriptional regulator YdeE
MNVQLKEFSEKTIAGYSFKIPHGQEELTLKCWDDIMKDGRHNALYQADFLVNKCGYASFHFIDNKEEFEYVIGLELQPGQSPPENLVVRKINSGTYATIESSEEQNPQLWPAMFKWIADSGYSIGASCFELYDNRMENGIMEIWIQIQK